MDPDLDQQGSDATGAEIDTEALDWSQLTESPEQSTNTGGQATEVVGEGDNPKWAKFLEAIPREFHEPVKAQLKEWDQGVNQRFQEIHQQYEPFKPFRERNIDPQRLDRAYQLAERLAQDPVGFYNDLRTGLISRGQLADAQEVQQEAQADVDEFTEGDPYAQRMQQLEEELRLTREQTFAAIQQQQYEEQVQAQIAVENQRIDQAFTEIEQKAGATLPNELRASIIEKAMVMGQQQQRYVGIQEAANEVFRTLAAAQKLRRTAPKGIPTGGSVPHTPLPNPGEMSKEQRFARAEEIRRRIAAENQGA